MSDADVYGMIFGGMFICGIVLEVFIEYRNRKK